jgi:hypothetical protein
MIPIDPRGAIGTLRIRGGSSCEVWVVACCFRRDTVSRIVLKHGI